MPPLQSRSAGAEAAQRRGRRPRQALSALLACLIVLGTRGLAAQEVVPAGSAGHTVLFLPQDGLALDAATGRLRWRFPRYQGATYSDHGQLLLTNFVTRINRAFHLHESRLCRLNPDTGKTIWCRNQSQFLSGALDARGDVFYVQRVDRVDVLRLTDGRRVQSVSLRPLTGGRLLPLPDGGVMIVESDGNGTRILQLLPAAAPLVRQLPATLYPFQGDPRGLVFYNPRSGEFLDPLTLHIEVRRLAEPRRPFPRVSVDAHGLVFSDWDSRGPLAAGRADHHPAWSSPSADVEPRPLVVGTLALLLEKIPPGPPNPTALTRLEGRDLETGGPRFATSLVEDFPEMHSDGTSVALLNPNYLVVLDAHSGEERWRLAQNQFRFGALTPDTVIVWENLDLTGFSARNGTVRWRVQFRFADKGKGGQ
ncbi:MAG: outer membrane protein assembly factor BamB family protein [Terriglobales bacterium]